MTPAKMLFDRVVAYGELRSMPVLKVNFQRVRARDSAVVHAVAGAYLEWRSGHLASLRLRPYTACARVLNGQAVPQDTMPLTCAECVARRS